MRHQGEQASKHSRVANRTTGINAQTHAADPGLGHRPNKKRGNPRHPEPPAANLRTGPRRCRRCLGISGVRRPGWPSVLAPTGGSPDESGDVSDGPGMSPHPPGKLLRTPRGGRFESGLSWANRVKTTRTRTGIATAYSLSQRIQPTPSRYSDQPENPPSGDR